MSLRKDIIMHLEKLADLMEFIGENKFKVNAFRNGANIIRRLEEDLEKKINDNSIGKVKGIGKSLLSVILEFNERGTSKNYEQLILQIPNGILDIMTIRGLGARKVKIIADNLNIQSINELEQACKANKIANIKGFGEKTELKILKEIERIKRNSGYMLLNQAENVKSDVFNILKDIDSILKVNITGQLRRIREIISEIEFILLVDVYEDFDTQIRNFFDNIKISANTSYKIYTIKTELPAIIKLYVTDNNIDFNRNLFLTTGSEEFIEKAKKGKREIPGISEEQIFNELSLPYIIPEMREQEYFDLSENLKENSDIIFGNLNGLIHFHTIYSDGMNSLTEMVNSAKNSGFEYAVVTDHSKSAFYANGLNEKRILLQKEEIKKFNSENEFKIFQGIESDILRNGDLDYENDFLNNFDFIIASIHSQFNLTEKEMTDRIIKAVENPHTNLLGHPTGRLLLSRDPYKVDMKKVIEACAENNVAIEINSNPHRLDLDWRLIYFAREKDCHFAINPDAHSVDGIMDILYGIKIAEKGGIKQREVINYLTKEEFIKYLNNKKSFIL